MQDVSRDFVGMMGTLNYFWGINLLVCLIYVNYQGMQGLLGAYRLLEHVGIYSGMQGTSGEWVDFRELLAAYRDFQGHVGNSQGHVGTTRPVLEACEDFWEHVGNF